MDVADANLQFPSISEAKKHCVPRENAVFTSRTRMAEPPFQVQEAAHSLLGYSSAVTLGGRRLENLKKRTHSTIGGAQVLGNETPLWWAAQ